MESTEKCEAIIQHFNGKFIKIPPGVPGACQRWCFSNPNIAAAGAETSVFLCWLLPSLSHMWLLQCLRSPYYVSLQTEVRRRGRTRGNTSRMDGPGPEMETRWAGHFRTLQTWTSCLAFFVEIKIQNMFRKQLNFSLLCYALADFLCFFVVFFTFVQAAVSVCMISQVLNPVHCFPREEWRLRMTRQPYKMGEWYARTDWKQPHCCGWKVLV